MTHHLEKNYYHDEKNRSFFRIITEDKHKLWSGEYHGLAAFNKDLYDQYKNVCERIGWLDRTKTPYRKYSMPIHGETGFDAWKITLNFKEPQVTCIPLSVWECKEL